MQVLSSLMCSIPRNLCKPSHQIEAAIKRVEGFADEAQADLGLDYAWLDDVTVNDWTRYHDLARSTSEEFFCRPLADICPQRGSAGEISTAPFSIQRIQSSRSIPLSSLSKNFKPLFRTSALVSTMFLETWSGKPSRSSKASTI